MKLKLRLIMAMLCAAFTLTFTGCAMLGLGEENPLDSLLGLGQRADAAFTQYQALVTAGQLPANAEVTEAYLEYRMYFDLLQTILKPTAKPPPAAIEKAQAVTSAVNTAKAKAAAAKRVSARN